MKKYLITTLKITVAVIFLYVVFRNIDQTQFIQIFKTLDIAYLLAAFLLLLLAQLVSAYRLRYYFSKEGYTMPRQTSLAIYFIGCLFNAILPGGIGGDGYQMILLNRLHHCSNMLALRRIISGRANGLLLLFFYTSLLIGFSSILTYIPFGVGLVAIAMIMIVMAYFMAVYYLLKEPPQYAIGAMPFSCALQGVALLAAWCIIEALPVDYSDHTVLMDYLTLFMISCIVAVIPISIGGIGIREYVFYQGAVFIPSINQEVGIAFGILFFLLQILSTLPGLWYYFRMKYYLER